MSFPANSPPLEPPLPGEAAPAPPDEAAHATERHWTSPTEVVMRLSPETLRELEAGDEFKLHPPELKPSQILAKLEHRQPTSFAPKIISPLLDDAIREQQDDDGEAIPREPWQFSLQEMMWASAILLVGIAFTRLIVSHPVFLTLGILAWCGLFIIGRLHFRDPDRIAWVAVQAMGFTYAAILWIGFTF